MNQNYVFDYQAIKNRTLGEFKELIESTKGKKLNELRVKDLVFQESVPILYGYGVYIFKRENKIIYVGKASSKSFIERIPPHLDFRINSWFNNLLITIRNQEYGNLKWNDESAIKLSLDAFNELNLILINIYDNNLISDMEELLIALLKPYNGSKRIKNIQLDMKTTIENNLMQ